ncbi:MAG: ABC transporter permease subunit [Pseudomonadota bacterium]
MAQSDIADQTSGSGSSAEKGSILYDPKVRGLFFQIVLLAALIAWVLWVRRNTLDNLEAQGQAMGFDFLAGTSGFQILTTLGTWVFDYQVGSSTYWDVFLIGIVNTFAVAFLGIIVATVLGFVMGVFRLSSNFILRGFATVYVEIFRNIPLLLWLFILYFAVLRNLPDKRDKVAIWGESVGLNITGLYAPFPITYEGFWMSAVAVLVAVVLWIILGAAMKKRQEATGQQFPTFWVGLGMLVAIPTIVFYSTGAPLEWEYPVFTEEGPVLRRGYQAGIGMVIVPEMIAVWAALTLYTAAFIAEIVRAGILAVPHGQSEAAGALGLRPQPTLNLVVIPQALRVIIPPLTSQYLNLTKNSSLAVAIAYPELVSVFAGTALNQVGRALEMVFMMMMVYLFFSIATALFMNWFNSRMRLVER